MANPFINPNDPNMQTQNPDLSQILLPPAPAPSFAAHMANPANIAAIAPSVAPRSVVTPSNAAPKPNSIFNAASNWFAAAPPVNTAGMASMAPSPLAALPPSPMASAPAPVVNTAGMGAAPLPSVTPATSPMVQSGLQSKTQADQQKLTDLQNQGAGLNQIHNGFLRGLARAGDIAGSILAPGVAAQLPGTTLHNRVLQNRQQGIVAQDQQQVQQALQNQDTQSQISQRNAVADLNNQKTDFYTPVTVTKEQALAIGMPQLEGTELDHRSLSNLLAGQQKGTIQTGIQAGKNQTAQNVATTKADAQKSIQDAKDKTQALLQDKKSSTSIANTNSRIASKGQTGGGNFKVPADVTKRAALASNVNENADAVDEIVNRRPEIVGAAGGRYSNVQQMIGSDDPDIQALGVRIHNIALASNGAHGVRSAEAVQKTENELFNNFKTGPNGIKGGLNATRSSVQTFIDDESNFQNSGRRTGGGLNAPMPGKPVPPPKAGAIEDGHRFKGGNPADPNNWEMVKK